jgi:hypothetical protein
MLDFTDLSVRSIANSVISCAVSSATGRFGSDNGRDMRSYLEFDELMGRFASVRS